VRVVIAGGGTAGHVVPAVALAAALRGEEVSFVGTRRGAEARLVPQAGLALETIEVGGFDRSRPLSIVPTGVRALRAVYAARRLLAARRPDVVVGVGGYVSLPACLAARMLSIPVALHEQNIVLGLANRVSLRFARRVGVSFEETLAETRGRGVLTGNPVAPEVAGADLEAERSAAYRSFDLDEGRKTLLVFGGSQGARRINDAAAGLATLWGERNDLQVLHITGRDHAEAVRSKVAAGRSGLPYRVVDYVERMAAAYAVADLALCRGGATTVAELAVAGVPAIVVPYPHHRDRQQERHGRVLEAAGAAIVLDDAATTPERVSELALRLLEDADALRRMKDAAAARAIPDAAERLAALVREVAA